LWRRSETAQARSASDGFVKSFPWRFAVAWIAYNVILVVTFLTFLSLNMQMQPEGSLRFLDSHWGHAFPPREPAALLWWLLETHTGNMMAYPAGGKNFASSLTLLLFLVGVGQFAWLRCWQLLGLCLAPFALTFVAAALHRYPYGDSARLCQH